MKKRLQQERACCQQAEHRRKLAWSTDPKEAIHSTQIAATQAEAAGYLSVGLRAEIGLNWMSSREIFRRGRQNPARFRSDQGEKRGERLFNNRGLREKGLLFLLYFSYLSAVSNITESKTEYLYWVCSGR